ncbi:MAG TPA: hypothetical protein VGR46_08320 [Candidatus Limnocylindria bacterium]|nr:hypothetical protein [Candidatus Limnocylindria bacterium]
MSRGIAAGLGIGAAVLIAVALVVYVVRVQGPGPPATPAAVATSPTPTATTLPTGTPTRSPAGTVAATPTQAVSSPGRCDTYQAGDIPIVPLRASGQWLKVAFDAVRPGQSGHNRWMVRFTLAETAPAAATIGLNAAASGPSGPLQVFGYEAGPPNSESVRVTAPITLQPCGAPGLFSGVVVLGVETAGVRTGSYTLTLRDIRRPEGDTVQETWTVALTCTVAPGAPGATPATDCR